MYKNHSCFIFSGLLRSIWLKVHSHHTAMIEYISASFHPLNNIICQADNNIVMFTAPDVLIIICTSETTLNFFKLIITVAQRYDSTMVY